MNPVRAPDVMHLSLAGRPDLSTEVVAECVNELYGVDGTLTPLPAEWDQNFRLDAGVPGTFVVKIANRDRSRSLLEFENAAMARLAASCVADRIPRIVTSRSGEEIISLAVSGGPPLLLRVLTFVHGEPLAGLRPQDAPTLERVGRFLGELDACLAGFMHPAMDRSHPWDLRRCMWIGAETGRIGDGARRSLVERILLQYRARVCPEFLGLPCQVIHNDGNDENLLLAPCTHGGCEVAGLLDFGDMLRSHAAGELAVASAYAAFGAADPVGVLTAMAVGYHRARPLAEAELGVLFPMVCMRLCVSVTVSAMAASEDPANAHRQVSDGAAWALLERLEAVEWREAEERLRAACGVIVGCAAATAPGVTATQRGRRSGTVMGTRKSGTELRAARASILGPSLSLAYERPLEIVRGRGAFLFGRDGRAYLDCVNNVCHVGHSHPGVVAALSAQAARLNTNTRYLHPSRVAYAERLAALLPDPLAVCYFVNSGSEANELAVRLAHAHTGRRDAIVLERAYHGNTTTLVALSPYKCEGPGGRGLAEWAHKVPCPDGYTGPHRGTGKEVGHIYAAYVRETCEWLSAEGRPPAFFLCESLLGCGGQVVPPEGYLREAYAHVRAAGGVCVADEVQVGMGRVGSHWWAFEAQGAVPDIVTLGKPIGNGHPVGAVVTTAEVAHSFANGMEFFSTFGGNPVSMEVGLAVLEVMEEERLRERAERVGRYLLDGFRVLAARHPAIGDVRGMGMFIGVELVRDTESRAPATELTSRLIERAKDDGVLLSAEGLGHNVLKVKPPLAFAEPEANLLLGSIDRALAAIDPEA